MATEKTKAKTTNKNDRIYVRLNDQVKRDFETLAAYRGLNTSALMHSLIVQTIHRAREEKPDLFIYPATEMTAQNDSFDKENSSLSGKLLSGKKSTKKDKTFTTGDGKTIPLVEEGSDDK